MHELTRRGCAKVFEIIRLMRRGHVTADAISTTWYVKWKTTVLSSYEKESSKNTESDKSCKFCLEQKEVRSLLMLIFDNTVCYAVVNAKKLLQLII